MKLFLVSWLVIIVMLTLATLRLPSAFSVLFGLVDLALLLLLLAFAEASAAGVPSSGLLKTGGYVVLIFAALGVYLFFSAASAGHRRQAPAARHPADALIFFAERSVVPAPTPVSRPAGRRSRRSAARGSGEGRLRDGLSRPRRRDVRAG